MPDSDARTVILRRCARMWPPSALVPAVRTRLGGPARARVIVLFACLLGLETADLASLGAIAGQLKPALHLHNTQLGILAAAPALVAIFATLPLGVLADRTRRTPVLAVTTATWAVAMLLSAASSSFDELLVARFFLGAATAASAPLIASLVGDLFWPEERGRVYGYILGGQLLGSSFGLLVIGNLTAFSWRIALVVLALPSVALALAIARLLPEPARGGASRLQQGARKIYVPKGTRRLRRGRRDTAEHAPHRDPAVERVVRRTKAAPRKGLVLREDPFAMPLKRAVVYVLRLPTNVLLIISSALGYFFQAGVNTFGVVFVIAHFGVSQMAATSLLALVALGALAGNVIGGRIADALLARGYLPARMVVGGTAFVASSAIFVPGLETDGTPLRRVDAHTKKVVASFPLTGVPSIACGMLWLTRTLVLDREPYPGVISRIEPETGARTASLVVTEGSAPPADADGSCIALTGPNSASEEPTESWIGTLDRSGKSMRRSPKVAFRTAIMAGHLWIRRLGGIVQRIDAQARTDGPLFRLPIEEAATDNWTIVTVDGQFWVVGPRSAARIRLD